MKTIRLPLFAALALAVLLPFAAVNETAAANASANAGANGPLRPLTAAQVTHRLTSEVYGFLPYWLENSQTAATVRFDLLSTVAFFDIGLNPDGSVNRTTSGYLALTSPAANAIIRAAHRAGVRVDLTLANFGFLKNRAFLRNPAAQRRAIKQIVAIMAVRGLDGIALDLESVYRRDLPDLGHFVDALARAVHAHNHIGRVTVAVGASQAGEAMAEAALAGHADRVLIMGYDYRSGASTTTGSTDPLVRRGGGMSLTWTVNLFKAARLPMNRIILALPYYGMSWPTTSARPGIAPARAAYGRAPAYAIRVSKVMVPNGSRHGYDPVEASAWVATYVASLHIWRQTYYDSPASLSAKYAFARSRGLAGVGLWALGYDAGSSLNWQVLARAFQRPPAKAHPLPKKIHKIVHKAKKHVVKPKTHPAKHAPAKVAPTHPRVSKAL